MTETPILSGGAPTTDDGVGMLPTESDGDGVDGGNRRRLLIIGAVAGIIILAAAAYLLLHKGSSSPSSSGGLVPRGVVHSAPAKPHAVTKTPKKGGTTKLPKVAKHPAGKDPFVALIAPAVVTSGSPASSTTVTTPTTAPTTPVTTPTTGTTTTGTGKTAGGPLWIELTSATSKTAQFKVGFAHHKFRDFTVQAPKATSDQGTVFAKEFALISVQDGAATIQIGDGAPFILTVGISHVA
jgi:hypothetical protein